MFFKCLDCGHLFEDGEQATWTENYAGTGEYPATQFFTGCPICRGDYEETRQCKICGAEYLPDELRGGVCDDCIEEYRYNLDACYIVGSTEKEAVELNSMLTAMFSKEDIEEILLRELKQAEKIEPIDCNPFIDADIDWFGETLSREVK